jgi:uncharacterized protein YdeI (YjbR/CyaY-like superfamily)
MGGEGWLFFGTGEELRAWFVEHHADATELVLGFWKVGTGRPSVTWSEAVDEALCFGWIDGVRRRIDEASYSIRFTPRRPGSNWSSINLAKVEALTEQGRMTPAGLAAHAGRTVRVPQYSFEQQAEPALDPLQQRQFRSVQQAWTFFERQAPSYRKRAIWWVVSAKREETKVQRLAKLIALSGEGRTL